MVDPATGAALSTAAGSLTLINAIIKICGEHEKNPDATPPNVAELIALLPAAALQSVDELIGQVKDFRAECLKSELNLNLPLDTLQHDTWFWQRRRRRLLKTFQIRIDAIGGEISTLFDDLVAVSDCADRLHAVARSFEASRQQKEALRRDTDPTRSIGKILDSLQTHAERARADLGDLNRK